MPHSPAAPVLTLNYPQRVCNIFIRGPAVSKVEIANNMLSVLNYRDHARKVVLVHKIAVAGVFFLMYILFFISSFWIVTAHTELLCGLKLVMMSQIPCIHLICAGLKCRRQACQICELKRPLPFPFFFAENGIKGLP